MSIQSTINSNPERIQNQVSPVEVIRNRENQYLIRHPFGKIKPIILKVADNIGTQEEKYELVNAFASTIFKELSDDEIKKEAPLNRAFKGRNYLIVKGNASTKGQEIASIFTNMIPAKKGDWALRFDIKLAESTTTNVMYQQLDAGANVIYHPWEKKSHPLSSLGECQLQSYIDPFTQLATLAFQHQEEKYDTQYSLSLNEATRVIVVEKGELTLKSVTEPVDAKQYQEAVRLFQGHLIAEYGEERLLLLQHQGRFDLKQMLRLSEPLTAEHVYRANILGNSVTSKDVEGCFKSLKNFVERCGKEEKILKLSLNDDTVRKELLLSNREYRKLIQLLQKNKEHFPTVAELVKWWNQFPKVNLSSELSPPHFNRLIEMLALTSEELGRVLTGREISDSLKSGYTTAKKDTYKPWIDQQELLQCISGLHCEGHQEANKKWELYMEELVHVLVKIQLVKEHPFEGYYLGDVIPAPQDDEGNRRWYKVTSCVNNGYGNLNYTLEPACKDTSLPAIKLYRSTASDKNALDGSATIRNDINPLNPPGYEGLELGNEYEVEFFKERSIPVWVGYTHLASQALESGSLDIKTLQQCFSDLKNANESLYEEFEKPLRHKSFLEIIKKYDYLLNDLAISSGAIVDLLSSTSFLSMYYNVAEKYQHSDQKANEKEGAKELRNKILSLVGHNKELKLKFASFLEELDAHILTNKHTKLREKQIHEFKKSTLKTLKKFKKEVKRALNSDHFLKAHGLLHNWNTALEIHAMQRGEEMKGKKNQDLMIAGHSLGGALAQVNLHHFLTSKSRIPLPGHQCSVFSFDSPRIKIEDNEEFKEMDKHADLMSRMKVLFPVGIRFEAGDPVPLAGGGVPLRAEKNSERDHRLQQWAPLNAAISQRLPESTSKIMVDAENVHGTRFGRAEEVKPGSIDQEGDYIRTYLDGTGLFSFANYGQNSASSCLDNSRFIHQEIANMPFFVNGDRLNNLRTSMFFQPIRFALQFRDLRPRDLEYRDANGVFAVDEKGVISKGKDVG